MKVGVLQYPGSSGAADAAHVLTSVLAAEVRLIHHDQESLGSIDLLVLPGGAAFCDYLRPGALARTSASASAVRKFARSSPVLGIGNGFQILCELGILPGALLVNEALRFVERPVWVRLEDSICQLTRGMSTRDMRRFPIACLYGCYYTDARTIAAMEEKRQVVFRFSDQQGDPLQKSPTGSSIAGVTNAEGNVLGIICHPERVCEAVLGGIDGLEFFHSVLQNVSGRGASPARDEGDE